MLVKADNMQIIITQYDKVDVATSPHVFLIDDKVLHEDRTQYLCHARANPSPSPTGNNYHVFPHHP